MEKPSQRFLLLLGLILVSAILISFILAYVLIYVIANYGTLALILASLGLGIFWFLYKKFRKR